MALKLDDLLSKKKDPSQQILDLSKVRIRNQEEFEKYFDKIPEYKIRPEKVSKVLVLYNFSLFFSYKTSQNL